ncbi:MAG TPA: GNAT family N-acetyltransferase [Xanthobacteraceae bacterium]|nr:GNAT family N-acetyltransferase [Xanthobacteraceae bacterium]
MSEDVRLAPVTASNWRAVVKLKLAPNQENFVASNVYSLAESKFDPGARPRAIYAGKRLVGFLMYEVLGSPRRPKEASIYRFMIDRSHQRKGYGRAALARAIEEIRAIEGVSKIAICYAPENAAARHFYTRFGFVETGRDEDGEIIAELPL